MSTTIDERGRNFCPLPIAVDKVKGTSSTTRQNRYSLSQRDGNLSKERNENESRRENSSNERLKAKEEIIVPRPNAAEFNASVVWY